MIEQPFNKYETELRREKSRYLPKDAKTVLDIGAGDGELWTLRDYGNKTIDIVEPNDYLRDLAAKRGIFRKIYKNKDEVDISEYDVVTLFGVLEHIGDDKGFLDELSAAKSLYLTVPNANSFHRYVGFYMGITPSIQALGSQDITIGHKRCYLYSEFEELLKAFCVTHTMDLKMIGTTSFKFLPSVDMLEFLEKIKDFNYAAESLGIVGPDAQHGAEIFAYIIKRKLVWTPK